VARKYLDEIMSNPNVSVTPKSIADELTKRFSGSGLSVPSSTKKRAAATMDTIRQLSPDLTSKKTVKSAVRNATGRPGLLAVPAAGAFAAGQYEDDDALIQHLLTDYGQR
jgi:hypothetical protein